MPTTRWTEADMADQTGRTALITGANSGIGYEAARALAQAGAHVVMACRNAERAEQAATRITDLRPSGSVEVLLMDLGDLDSVSSSGKQFLAGHDGLDLLVNNAGLMATPKGTTAQGFETQIGVNHLAHFALTAQLLPALLATSGSRVVSISSLGHRPGRINFGDLHSTKRYSPWQAYFQSKLANLLFIKELQRRLEVADTDTIAVAAHPGVSKTELGKEAPGGLLGTMMQLSRPFMEPMLQSAAMGALPTLRAATDPDAQGGDYYGPGGFMEQRGHPVKVSMSANARSATSISRLWDVSLEATGADYSMLDRK